MAGYTAAFQDVGKGRFEPFVLVGTRGGKLMGWMALAPIGVALRHNADVHIC